MIKKILLILGIVLLNLSLVLAIDTVPTVNLVAQPNGANILLVVSAYDEYDNAGIEWVKIYENGALISENTYDCYGVNPVLCEVDHVPVTSSVTYYAEAMDLTGNLGQSGSISLNLAPVITNINVPAAAMTQTSVVVNWDTSELSDSRVRYGLNSGDYTFEQYDATNVLAHSVTLTGLIESQTYYFVVESTDLNGDTTVSAESVFVPRNINAPLITNVVSNINTGAVPLEVTITWTTNEDSDSTVRYGTLPGTYTNSEYIPTVGLSHSVTIYGLSDSQTYYFVVESTDLDVPSNTARSIEYTFGVPDATAPVISGLNENEITLTTAKIVWNTDEPAESTIRYGTSTGVYDTVMSNSDLNVNHEFLLENLTDGETYYYVVESQDAFSNLVTSAERSFTTGRLIITFLEPDDDEEFNLGDTIEGEVRIENADLNDIEVDIEIVFYDDSENDEIETIDFDDKDIDSLDHEDFEFEFDLPFSLDEGNDYQIYVEVYVSGQKYKEIVDVDIDRDSHMVVIENVRTHVLGDDVEVSVDVENIGKKAEEDVYVELRVYGIGVNLVSDRFDLNEWDESGNSKTKVFRFDKPSEGVYTLEATVYYGSASDYVTEDFQVKNIRSSQNYDATLFEGNIQGVSSLTSDDINEESEAKILTMSNITWGIVDFLLLSVVIYGFVWLIRRL